MKRYICGRKVQLWIDTGDWLVGYYRSSTRHHVILIPTIVIRWERKGVS